MPYRLLQLSPLPYRPPLPALALFVVAVLGLFLATATPAEAQVQRFAYTNASGHYLVVEVLDDDLAHVELSAFGPAPSTAVPLYTSPQVDKTSWAGPSSLTVTGSPPPGNVLTTPELRLEVNVSTLCVTVRDATASFAALGVICPQNLASAWKGLTLDDQSMTHAYGLGQQFVTFGSADGDWTGRQRTPGETHGNAMVSFGPGPVGAVGNTQIPMLYLLGSGLEYGFFLDNVYRQAWDFTVDPWTVDMWGDEIRYYVMAGADLPDLRSDFLELTGRPPVPPKKTFGLWVSEYGYEDWDEILAPLSDPNPGKLATLEDNDFPLDGFVLDLQWFGGVIPNDPSSPMGTLTWDTTQFLSPAATIASLAADGVGFMAIEESYVSSGLAEHADLAARGHLVTDCTSGLPVDISAWWGRGAMIDWTDTPGADYWHDTKRQPLIADGILGHWTDLGEPEIYASNSCYDGVVPGKDRQADVHNLYNLLWHRSIADGYTRNAVSQRPFLVSRSGAAGLQRFGAAMWSADIGSSLGSLATHFNAQMHLSFSGIDYFGADIGGFHRAALAGNLDEMYTQWFANGALFDVPVRPHTENLANSKETAPDRIGHLESNRFNIRQRYELTPYYYSLAHRAYLQGEPVIPPLVFHYQDDPVVRELGHQKLIGRDLMAAVVASHGEIHRDVYLPAGEWVHVHTGDRHTSTGTWLSDEPVYRDGTLRLPLFARAGAIVPKMWVDEETADVLGTRRDGSTRDELVVEVYADDTATAFTLYEDDGETVDYRSGAVRTTEITQSVTGSIASVSIAPAVGTYTGAPASRDNRVRLVTDDAQATAVTLGGLALTQHASRAAFEAATSGWFNAGDGVVLARSGPTSVAAAKDFDFILTPEAQDASLYFVCEDGTTSFGQSVYVVGSLPELGSWSPAAAVKLDPYPGVYPTWVGVIDGLPTSTTFDWKCIVREEATSTVITWEPGANNTATTPAEDYGGVAFGDFVP